MIRGFTFFRSFGTVLKRQSDEDKVLLLDAMIDYMFFDKEPDTSKFGEHILDIWESWEPNLTSSKEKAAAGSKGGTAKKTQKAKK